MEFKAEANPRISITLDGRAEITFTTSKSTLPAIEELKDKDLLVKVTSFQKRRSLSQNAYLWVLLGELGQKLNLSKEELYKTYVKDYGVYEVLPIRNDVVERFIHIWQSKCLGWVCEVLKESKLRGYTNVIAYFGSSTYKTDEIKNLLDAVIRDCNEMGINTMSMSDIMLLYNENETK